MLEFYKSNKNFVIIFDGSNSKYLPSKLRVMQGKWIKDNKELIKNKCLGHIYLVNNILVQTMLKGILFVQKPPIKYDTASSLKSAYEKARAFLS